MNFIGEHLKITAQKEGNQVTLTWTGKSASKHLEKALNPYLERIVHELKEEELVVELRDMVFMNTSTFPVLIQFFRNLDNKGIATKVVYDRSADWQHISFKGLEVLVRIKMKSISIVGV